MNTLTSRTCKPGWRLTSLARAGPYCLPTASLDQLALSTSVTSAIKGNWFPVQDHATYSFHFPHMSSAGTYWINVWWPSNLHRNCIKAKWACSDLLALTGLWQVHSPEWTSSNETYLLLEMMGTLHPLIWFSSVSETSICSGRRGTQTVISKGALRCW